MFINIKYLVTAKLASFKELLRTKVDRATLTIQSQIQIIKSSKRIIHRVHEDTQRTEKNIKILTKALNEAHKKLNTAIQTKENDEFTAQRKVVDANNKINQAEQKKAAEIDILVHLLYENAEQQIKLTMGKIILQYTHNVIVALGDVVDTIIATEEANYYELDEDLLYLISKNSRLAQCDATEQLAVIRREIKTAVAQLDANGQYGNIVAWAKPNIKTIHSKIAEYSNDAVWKIRMGLHVFNAKQQSEAITSTHETPTGKTTRGKTPTGKTSAKLHAPKQSDIEGIYYIIYIVYSYTFVSI